MRELIYGHDAEVASWVQRKINHADFHNYVAIGLLENNRLIAGVVYHNHYPAFRGIEMSIAAETPRWASREAIRCFLSYPFIQLRCKRVTACVGARNDRAKRFLPGIGFRKEGTIRQGYGNEDVVIYGMLYSEAKRWLYNSKRLKNGQKIRSESAASARS